MANSMSDYLYDLRVVRLTKSVSTDVLSTFLQKKSNCYVYKRQARGSASSPK